MCCVCVCVVCVSWGAAGGEWGKRKREGETLVGGERMRERTPCNDRGGKKKTGERDPMQYSSPAMDFHLIHKKTI